MTILPYTLKQKKQVPASLFGYLRGAERRNRSHGSQRSRDAEHVFEACRHIGINFAASRYHESVVKSANEVGEI